MARLNLIVVVMLVRWYCMVRTWLCNDLIMPWDCQVLLTMVYLTECTPGHTEQNDKTVSLHEVAGRKNSRRPTRFGQLRKFCTETSSRESQSSPASGGSLQVQ